MIKINLLTAERPRAAATSRLPRISLKGQQVAIGCGLILVLSAGIILWRWQQLGAESVKLDADISAAQQETVRLHSVIGEVQKFEQRRTQLQQRVTLIEQLRKDQTGPVHILDQLSLALPPMMWLTDLKQSPGGVEVVIDGRSTGLTTLSDFVANLEASGYFKKSVEIVSTQLDPSGPGELIRFSLKAQFQRPAPAPVPNAAAAANTTPAPPLVKPAT
ncbi:MAG: PilN domain-containing protein [Vicinamibacterales bacterium]